MEQQQKTQLPQEITKEFKINVILDSIAVYYLSFEYLFISLREADAATNQTTRKSKGGRTKGKVGIERQHK